MMYSSVYTIIFCGLMSTLVASGCSQNGSEPPIFTKAMEAYRAEDYEQALSLFTESLRVSNNLTIYVNRGNCYSYLNNLEAALADYDTALAEAQKIWDEQDPRLAHIYYNIGYAYDRIHHFAEAIPLYEKAIALDQHYPEVRARLARARARQAAQELRHEEAIVLFTEALKHWDNPEHYLNRGICYLALERLDEALLDLNTALTKAIKECGNDTDPELAAFYEYRGLAYEKARNYAKALQDYEHAVNLAKFEDFETYNSFAWFLATCPVVNYRDAQKALEYAQKASELSHYQDELILDTLAAAYAVSGNFQEAIAWQQKAIELTKDSVMETDFSERLHLYLEGKIYIENP